MTNLAGNAEGVDKASGLVLPTISNHACRVPGQPSQCSRLCGALPHSGQLGSIALSIKRCCCCYNHQHHQHYDYDYDCQYYYGHQKHYCRYLFQSLQVFQNQFLAPNRQCQSTEKERLPTANLQLLLPQQLLLHPASLKPVSLSVTIAGESRAPKNQPLGLCSRIF